jgi:hypothetical protein
MHRKRCFALRSGKCLALTGGLNCIRCGFYKTAAELEIGQAEAHRRIAKLPWYEQKSIADKYYGGTFPWDKAVAV